jgi:hypothetical protein
MDPRREPVYAKGTQELAESLDRFRKRSRYLFDAEGRPKHPPEEFARRVEQLERQFERSARKIEKRAGNVEASAVRTLEGADDEAAQRRLEAARALKRRVEETRAGVAEMAADGKAARDEGAEWNTVNLEEARRRREEGSL